MAEFFREMVDNAKNIKLKKYWWKEVITLLKKQ